jgi:hypothetical protein
MSHPQIKFGTDGWRGVIADDFTFAKRTAAEAIAAYIHAKEDPPKAYALPMTPGLAPGICPCLRRGGRGDRYPGAAGQ